MGGEADLIKMAAQQGIFVLMFVLLFVWTIKESTRREARLMQALDELTKGYSQACSSLSQLTADMNTLRESVQELATTVRLLVQQGQGRIP